MSYLNNAYLRFFIDNGMATNIIEQLGLENAWGSEFAQYGFAEVGSEALTELGDVHYFYVIQEDTGSIALAPSRNCGIRCPSCSPVKRMPSTVIPGCSAGRCRLAC
ncbi:MAG: hypothetical protein KF828_04965 [Anaerolineales bacterium]|nr:hypothetical protein [Anaerolineales bacterium]